VTACVVLLKWAALASLEGPPRFWVIALFPVLSRWAMMLALSAFQYARNQGLGTAFQGGRPALGVGLATATAVGAAFLLATWGGLVMLGAVYVAALVLGAALARLLGGLTGDTYGAINEVTEVAALMVAVGLMPIDWLRPVTQL
jgi:adenosylcobinamide-GDP ribazoletransferase